MKQVQEARQAEATHSKALTIAREKLGDKHPITQKSIQAMIDVKTKIKVLMQTQGRSP